jgi:hypothetical protein
VIRNLPDPGIIPVVIRSECRQVQRGFIISRDRQLFFLALVLGAATFTFFGSLLATIARPVTP